MSLISDRLEIGLSINTTNWRICLVLYFYFGAHFIKLNIFGVTMHFCGYFGAPIWSEYLYIIYIVHM